MSKSDRDQVLEKNVEQLLAGAHEPPRMDAAARARVLARLKERIRPDVEPAGRPGRGLMLVGAGLASAALAVAAIGLVTRELPVPEVHANAAAAPQRIALADGTEVILDRGAEVRVLGDRALRLVRGRALLDVVPGAGPFLVQTPHGRVEVLGTRFQLETGTGETTAAVVRGRVRIAGGGGDVVLSAGQVGTLHDGARPTRRPAPRLSHLTSWARTARKRQEKPGPGPARRGTLLARDPNIQSQEFPLPMRELVVDVRVEDQVARVAIDQTFFNPQPRMLEGVYQFPLPPDAAISRLAMYVDGARMEAAVVERERGRRIYESIVYRRLDPALLEWMEGNLFKVRVFPLPARQEKRLLLSYTQTLPRLYDDVHLQVPIPQVDAPVARVRYRARLVDCAGCEVRSTSHEVETEVDGADLLVWVSADHHVIGDDLLLTIRDPMTAPRLSTHASGDQRYAMVRARPALPEASLADRRRRWVVLHDTSASRGALELKAQSHIIDRLTRELDEDDELAVLAFDTRVRAAWPGFTRVDQVDRRALASFLAEQSAGGVGATDLGAAVEHAATLLDEAGGAAEPHILYLGDGIATAEELDAAALEQRLAGRATMIAAAVGDRLDAAVLRGLASATGGMFVTLNPGDDLDWRVFDLVAALDTPRAVDVEAELLDREGQPIAAQVYASTGQLAGGDEIAVVARLAGADPASLRLRGRIGGQPWEQTVTLAGARTTEAGYLPRLWARSRVEALRGAGDAEARAEIAALGLEHFLVTPETSLLVLENPAMYLQHGVTENRTLGWAAYEAPDRIEVVHEPSGSGAVGPAVPANARLVRTPVPMLRSSGTGSGYGWLAGATSNENTFIIDGVLATGSTTMALRETAEPTVPLAEAALPASDGERPKTVFSGEPRADVSAWSASTRGNGSGDGAMGKGPRRRAAFDRGVTGDRNQQMVGQGRGGGGGISGHTYYASAPYPAAMNRSGDPRLDDLTELVPGMFETGFDLAEGELRGSGPGSITAEARVLLERARRARRYRDERGTIITVRDGQVALERALGTGLTERVVFDGESVHHLYAELGLAVRRDARDLAVVAFDELAPMALAPADALARWYQVSLAGARIVRLERAGSPGAIEIALDEQLRPSEVTAIAGDARQLLRRLEYDGDAVVVSAGGRRRRYVIESAPALPAVATGDWTVVELPLAQPERRAAEVADLDPDSSAWRHAQRQRMASLAALGRRGELATVLRAVGQQGAPTRGELALASGAVGSIGAAELDELAPGDQLVSRYLRAAHGHHQRGAARAFDALSRDAAGTLIGMLATYRATLHAALTAGDRRKALGYLERLGAYEAWTMRYIAGHTVASRWRWEHPDDAVRAWDVATAGGPWRAVGAYEAARVLYQRGHHDQAADRFTEVLEALNESDSELVPPPLDRTIQYAFLHGSRGQAGWRLAWTRWRDRVLDEGEPHRIESLLRAAHAVGEPSDLDRIAVRMARLELDDQELATTVAGSLADVGRYPEAAAVLEPWLAGSPSARLLSIASLIEERRGDRRRAAALLERAIELVYDQPVELAALRVDYQRLVTLHGAVARAVTGEARAAAVRRALAAAAEWRRADPDNPALDRLVADLLFAVGQPEEAWRYLSSAIERHPMEGSAYQTVADALVAEGQVERAEALWRRAAEVDPTNPTWLLRRVQALHALGRADEVAPLIEAITEGEWHARWANVVWQARRLTAQR